MVHLLQQVFLCLLFSVVGVAALIGSFIAIDRLTPYDLWKEVVEQKNLALSITVGSGLIALGMIISTAIR